MHKVCNPVAPKLQPRSTQAVTLGVLILGARQILVVGVEHDRYGHKVQAEL